MLKKFLIAALALSSSACANFYVGGGVGVSSFSSKQETVLPPEVHHLGDIGFIGGGVVGYNYYAPCSNFDVGLEFFANGNTADAQVIHHQDGSKLCASSRYNLGVRLLPGYRFSNSAEGHLIVGYSYGSFKLKDNGVYGTIHKDFNANGFQVGLGTTLRISCHLSLRLDATYTGYSKHRRHGLSTGSLDNVYTLRPQAVDAMAMLIYEF